MDQKRSVTAAENGTSESGKKRLWQSFAYAYTKVWAGLGWAHEGLGWAEAGQTQLAGRGCGLSCAGPPAGWAGLGWAGWAGTKNEAPNPTRSGTAAQNNPKMDQKRSVTAAENGTSESGKKRLW